jgi:nitrate reductase (cytochrome), electron transfer subunit
MRHQDIESLGGHATMKIISGIITIILLGATLSFADDNIATLRGAAIDQELDPPRISRVENSDFKRKRAYPMQPPTIPHKTDDYQLDLNVNKCLSCHSRKQSEDSQAPMISVTHYQDRDGNFLADVSPRRYFCEQCHVVQTETKPLLENDFVDIDELLREDKR